MISWWLILLLSVAYVGILFWIAHWGDQPSSQRHTHHLRPLIYSLTLGVYCTSWTFYGAVGTATRTGWGFLPIYLGPILTFIFGWRMINRIIAISKRQNLTSIADFISARYGKGRTLAVLVTTLAIAGSVPYIALQLKAVASGFDIVAGGFRDDWVLNDTAFIFAIILSVFAVLFGTRQIDASEHHHGMMLAIAFESIVKLLAFATVGVFALYWLYHAGGSGDLALNPVSQGANLFSLARLPDAFVTQVLLASAAIFCLPRQFHVAVVEAHEDCDVRSARWMFPLYLLIFCIFVVPITYAGLNLLPSGSYAGDSFVLALPMTADSQWLTVLAFIGGFSAATGMVIVASVTLSTMVSNEIVMPLLFRIKQLGLNDHRDYSALLLQIRRIATVSIVLIAYTYYQIVDRSTGLAYIGLLSFAAAAQFAPLIVLGMIWPKANRRGAIAGLSTGFALWAYTLFLPSMERFGVPGLSLVDHGPFGFAWLRPEALFIDLGVHPLTHGVAWSLIGNIGVLTMISLLTKQSVNEKIQASAFVGTGYANAPLRDISLGGDIANVDLRALAERFVGAAHATRSFADFAAAYDIDVSPAASADRRLIQFTERLLAGAVGASSARVIITTALRRTGMEIGDVVILLDETSQAIRFNRQLLEATLENMSHGVSVVDASQRLIGWNSGYLDVMGYPHDLVYIGKPIVELMQNHAERGYFGDRKTVAKRMHCMQRGFSYRDEGAFPDGRVIEIRGQPMPDGRYVTTYSDITEFKTVETTLRDSEKRVQTYTDNVPAMIAYVDDKRCFRFANRAYAKYAGLPREEIVGRAIANVLDANELLSRAHYMDAAFTGQRQSFELELNADSPRPQYTLGTYIPDVDEHGKVIGIYAMFQDISVRRRAEVALVEAKKNLEQRVAERTNELRDTMSALQDAKAHAEEANASKTRFFAAAAHDILQPINAAKLFSALLTETSDGMSKDQRELVTRVESGLIAVEDLLNGLLEISRLDTGGHAPAARPFAVDQLFQALASQFQETCAERGLRLRFAQTSLWVKSDPALLRRILQNFISNAQRYTETGGVLVGCRRRGGDIAIAVYDTGVGIAERDLQKVFEEFHRLPGSQRNAKRGLGLGLAIVDRIALLLGHSIAMRSVEGQGSRFEVIVPRADVAHSDGVQQAPDDVSVRTPLAAQFVMCVDNEPEILDGMHALLSRWGVRPFTASGLKQAEQVLHQLKTEFDAVPRLLLVDYHLDDNDTGIDVIERLRALAGEPIPAVVLTADRTDDLHQRVVSAGYSILHKPVKPAALRALITSMLSKTKVA